MLVIGSPCLDVKDGICTTACPVDCIYEGERMFYIHPDECIECGLCESICPVDAIRYADELPPQEAAFAAINRDAFAGADGQTQAPGGWRRGMAQIADPQALRDWTATAAPLPIPERNKPCL